jgi:hypothetical protein
MKILDRERLSANGGRFLWWLGTGVFLLSLVLPIRDDWSQAWAGGWYAYLWGLVLIPGALVSLPAWLVNGEASGVRNQDAIELVFLLTWLANPLSHVAAIMLGPAPSKRPRRVVPLVLTGLAFVLALLAGILDVGRSYHSLQRSPAYFAWAASMALLLVLACARLAARPRDDGRDGGHDR